MYDIATTDNTIPNLTRQIDYKLHYNGQGSNRSQMAQFGHISEAMYVYLLVCFR